MGPYIIAAVAALAVLVVAAVLFGIIRSWIKVARADEALIISGKPQKEDDGETYSTTVVVNGKAVVNPISQRYEVISLRSRQVVMKAEAQSSDNVTLLVSAVAQLKVGSDRALVRAAAERFASQDEAIERFTQDQLEGALRGVIAQQTVTSLMRDRKQFSEEITGSVKPELQEQGLILDSFQITSITDNVGYIASLGAPEIEAKRQSAEIAQTNSERAIARQRLANSEQNLIEQTAYETNQAKASSEVGREQAAAEQARNLASEQARQAVLNQQAENKQSQLDADVKRVADAELYRRQQAAEAEAFEQSRQAKARAEIAEQDATATRLRAEAEADSVRLAGEAKAAAIKAEADALRENLDAVLAQRALEILPEIMREFSANYARIGGITVIGGSEASAGAQVAGEPALAMAGMFESVKAATGLDLASLIQGRATGEAAGAAMGQAMTGDRREHRHAGTSPDGGSMADGAGVSD